MRISDWSSDVCSSDLVLGLAVPDHRGRAAGRLVDAPVLRRDHAAADHRPAHCRPGEPGSPRPEADRHPAVGDRKSVVWGKSVSVRVDLGGRRSIKKKKTKQQLNTIQTQKSQNT